MDIREYINARRLALSDELFDSQVESYIREMERGLAGQEGSMKMIPSYLGPEYVQGAGRRVIAVDMGGTNLRLALVGFDGQGTPLVVSCSRYALPGVEGPVSAEQFFDVVAEYLRPVISESDRIGICFSFPCEIQPDLDGKILCFDKEVRVTGAEGQSIAARLRSALLRRGLPYGHRIVVTNDSVAALLAGRAVCRGDELIGFILGTGVNCCYAEQNAKITKNQRLRGTPGKSLINMESGGYAGLPRNEVDSAFVAATGKPGGQLFEKMVSGAYLGGLLTAYIRDAAGAGCFSGQTAAIIARMDTLRTKDIDDFFQNPESGGPLSALAAAGSDRDREALAALANAVLGRSACFIAISLCGILRKTGMGRRRGQPAVISAEGSTFSKFGRLHDMIIDRMYGWAQNRYGIYCRFLEADSPTLVGTALAAMGTGYE